MSTLKLPLLIEPEELQRHLGHPELILADLSDRQTHAAYHIAGARHISYEQLTAETPDTPGPLRAESPLAQTLKSMGLTPNHHVIAYDDSGNTSACRLLWTLDLIGHPGYSLLNGGLRAWLDERRPTEQGETTTPPGNAQFSVIDDPPSAGLLYLLQHLRNPATQLVDVRTPDEYHGHDLRAQRGGHIPGAINLPHALLVSPEHSGRLRPETELRAVIQQHGIDPAREIIAYCQSHRRSALVYFAFKIMGFPNIKAYPGAWQEWGNNLDTPIE